MQITPSGLLKLADLVVDLYGELELDPQLWSSDCKEMQRCITMLAEIVPLPRSKCERLIDAVVAARWTLGSDRRGFRAEAVDIAIEACRNEGRERQRSRPMLRSPISRHQRSKDRAGGHL